MEEEEWFTHWFNQDYLHLYAERDDEEAERQVAFLIDQLHLTGKEKILDIGCGAGRHAFAFAKRGFSVVGIDISKELIHEAQNKLEKHPTLFLTFVEGDMRNLEGMGKFDLVINMFTSFGYFHTQEENGAIFAEIRKCLRLGGQFFLDYLHPFHIKQSLIRHEEINVLGEKVVIDKDIIGERVIKKICFPGRIYKENVALYSKEEVEQMLHEHRLQVRKVWDDYQGNPWKERGDRQLFLCTAI